MKTKDGTGTRCPARDTALAALLGAALALPAGAMERPGPDFAGDIVPPSVLAGLRGGLEIAGLDFDFTARLRTYVDEQLALASERRLTGMQDLRDAMNAGRRGVAEASAVSVQPSDTPGNVTATVTSPDTTGAAETIPPGVTRISHRVGPRGIQVNTFNTADGRSIRQALELEIDVRHFRNFNAVARDAIRARQVGRLLAR